jgi:uncharacterized membrane protein YtjA (UPF0391 family)
MFFSLPDMGFIAEDLDEGSPVVLQLKWALIFAVIAIVAGLLGFGGIAGAAAGSAKLLAIVALIVFVVFLVLGLVAAKKITCPPGDAFVAGKSITRLERLSGSSAACRPPTADIGPCSFLKFENHRRRGEIQKH